MKSFLGILIASVLLSACSQSGETVNVQDLNRQFIDAWNNKNADKITALMADDVDFLQGNVHYKGKSEVAQKWVQATLPTLANLKTNVVSSASDTRTAYEAGTFAVDVLTDLPDKPRAFGEGNFMLLWKKGDDGNWKLSYAQLEDLPVQAKN
ncbi:YybH family protein [Spirosoma aerophilum]